MEDWSFVGRDGLIIQYEDLISLTGFNIVKYISQTKNLQYDRMAALDSYLNRESFEIRDYVKSMTGFDISLHDMYDSKIALKPNLAYAFKMFEMSKRNLISELYIFSNEYSEVIDQFLKSVSSEIIIKYVHGDIVPVLRAHANCTYTTSDPTNIRKCVDVGVPFALTIVDDFQYVAPIVNDQQLLTDLENRHVYVQYTGVLSGGWSD